MSVFSVEDGVVGGVVGEYRVDASDVRAMHSFTDASSRVSRWCVVVMSVGKGVVDHFVLSRFGEAVYVVRVAVVVAPEVVG